MKKALLLGLMGGLLAAAPVLAHPPVPASVNFASEQGVPFGLALDGQPLTRGMARQVHVDQLTPGQHWADFTVPTAYGGAVRFRSRVWLQPGLETTFVLLARPGRPLALQQVNAVALYASGYGGNGYYQNGSGRYNSPASYGSQGGSYGTNDPYDDRNSDDDDDDDGNDGYSNTPGPDGRYGNSPSAPSSSPYGNPANGRYGTNPNRTNGGYSNGPTPGTYPRPATSNYRSLTPQDMDALVRAVQARIAEASKLSAAKDGLAQRSLRTDELSRLLRSLSSEACRVELATFAYSHIGDPENFSRVYEVFETESGARAVETAVNSASQR